MEKEALTALQGSIKKWEEILATTGYDDGTGNCPLCETFYGKEKTYDGNEECRGCPVLEKTGCSNCSNSPYEPWAEYMSKNKLSMGPGRTVFDVRSKELAQAELDFLKSLLPSGGEQGEESDK